MGLIWEKQEITWEKAWEKAWEKSKIQVFICSYPYFFVLLLTWTE